MSRAVPTREKKQKESKRLDAVGGTPYGTEHPRTHTATRRAYKHETNRCKKDTFYIDPRVEGCDILSSRAKRLGLQLKGFLGEGVTVCVVASSSSSSSSSGKGSNESAGDETTGAGAGLSRGQRLSRIHRMVIQAQTEPTAKIAGLGGRRQGHTSIADQARQLHATVLPGKAFGLWLERQEFIRAAAQGGGAAGAAVPAAAGGKGEVPARPLISRGRREATSRFKSQEHPRVVMKDLDGLEPERVQAFPPELLRKCILHTDAPPGMCPFIPREQWDRELVKMKKKDAFCGEAKVAARMPPAGPQKPRRGGWCECCERQYIGTMSEHCASDQHRAAVAADPNYAMLLELESWTGSDAKGLAPTASSGPSPPPVEEARTVSSSLPAAGAGAGGGAGVAGVVVGAGGANPASTVETVVAGATNERDEVRERSLAPAPGSEALVAGRGDAAKPGAAAGLASASHRRRGVSLPPREDVVNTKQGTSMTKEGSALRDAGSSPGQESTEGAKAGMRLLRSSPRRYPKPGQQASSAPCSGGEGEGGGGGEECVSPTAPPSVERTRFGSLKRSQRGGACGNGDAIPSREAGKDEERAKTGVVAGTPPQQLAKIGRSTRSSPMSCTPSATRYACVTTVLHKSPSELRKGSVGGASPAAAAAATPATSVLSNPSSQKDRSQRSSSRNKARCPSESPGCTRPPGSAFSPSSSRRAGRNPRRRGSSPGSGCKGDTAGLRSGTASPKVGTEVVRTKPGSSHGGGVETCSSTTAAVGSGTSPSARAESMGTTAQKRSQTRSAPRIAGRKPERVSAPSPLSDARKKDDERLKKRRTRQLKLLEDSPDFHGCGASSAGDSSSRVRTCDARGRSVTTNGSGSRRCSRGHRDGDGSATKTGGIGKPIRCTDNRGDPSGGSRREEEWRVKKRRKTRSDDEAAGSPSTDNGSPRESEAQTVGVVSGGVEHYTERAAGGGTSARAGRRRGCASSPDVPREGERLKPAKLPVFSGGDKGSSTRSRGGTRSRSKRRTPSTAGRMGLETAGDTSDDTSGDGSADDASPQSSPLSSGRNKSVPRSLGSRFAEDRGGDPTAPAARRKRAAIAASSESGPSGKRARATLTRSPRRIRA